MLFSSPELALTSYPPEDLLLRPGLHRRTTAAMEKLRYTVHGIALIVGHPHSEGGEPFNACSLIRDARIAATYRKQHLSNVSKLLRSYYAPAPIPPDTSSSTEARTRSSPALSSRS